jgi:hypothetical protein
VKNSIKNHHLIVDEIPLNYPVLNQTPTHLGPQTAVPGRDDAAPLGMKGGLGWRFEWGKNQQNKGKTHRNTWENEALVVVFTVVDTGI